MSSLAILRLKKDQERRLLAGHLWIYSNEVDTQSTPLKDLEPGQPVQILAGRDRWLGLGYVNPHSLICARLVTRRPGVALDTAFIHARLTDALALRERLYQQPFYRWVFGEADGLPGLIVDRYGSVLVLQLTTAGMERLREPILNALERSLQPTAILLRNDIAARELEGLASGVEIVRGSVPDTLELIENGVRFRIAPVTGQKTGWFYDQADNRARLRPCLTGGRVLDVCSYVGAWGIQAVCGGADSVLCLDSSATALEGVRDNAELNACTDRVHTRKGDAFDLLKQLSEAGEQFDVVLLDPPAFIKRQKDLVTGLEAYTRLNLLALKLIVPGGILITSSCSFHLPKELFLRAVQKAARRNQQTLQWLASGQQSADHPAHPAIPETAYLKTLYFRVLPAF